MRAGAVVHAERGTCLVPRVWRAESAWERLRGLLGRPSLGPGEGLWLEPCAMVHTVGMRYALDLAFIDRRGRVCRLVHGLAPARLAGCAAARTTLELAGGALAASGIRIGDAVRWTQSA
jgi:uncharacterized membrane protein (UPF0127 family)